MVQAHPTPVGNLVLDSLPPHVLASVLPKLDLALLPAGQELQATDQLINSVYFPRSGLILMFASLEDGTRAKVGLIGREGMLGSSLLSGEESSFLDASVQMQGTAWRMGGREFRQEVDANAPFRQAMLRYNEGQHAQALQTAACNGRHNLEQRLARWLLDVHDRADGKALPLTQEFMAMALSVHRPSLTLAAGVLQRAGLIRYASGQVTVLNRAGLEACSCECYGVVKRRVAAVLGGAAHRPTGYRPSLLSCQQPGTGC